MGYHEAMLDEWEQFYQQAKNNTSIDSDVVRDKAHELFDDIDSHLAATGSSLKATRSIEEDIVYFDTLVTDALDLLERKAVGTNSMAWYDPIWWDWEQSYEEAQNNTNIDALKEKANELFDIIDNLLEESGSSLKVKRTL
jgi:Rad3-related DNA helicase